MLIKIGDFEFSSVWDGVFYKKLSQYPAISDWEKRNIIEFLKHTNLGSQYPKERFRERIGTLVSRASISLVARNDAGAMIQPQLLRYHACFKQMGYI